MPAVSVITPAWNAAEFLHETIDSVRAQTFPDWEMLVVDDGSTDETGAIVERYAAADSRIRLLRQANAGPSAARNLAMRHARGAFFSFLDSDDQWDARFLAAQLDVFRAHPDTGLVTGTGHYLGGPLNGARTRPDVEGYPVLPLATLIRDENAVFIMTTFRREVFDRVGGFDEAQWTSEDYDFWLRAAAAGFVFRCNPQPLGHYRVRGDSLSRNRARMIRGILQTFAKARPRCVDEPLALAALETQVARFERELLLEEGKDALERGDYPVAAQRLRALHARGGGALVGVTAWLAAHAPRIAALAYRARAWRPSRLRPRAGRRKQDALKEVVV